MKTHTHKKTLHGLKIKEFFYKLKWKKNSPNILEVIKQKTDKFDPQNGKQQRKAINKFKRKIRNLERKGKEDLLCH